MRIYKEAETPQKQLTVGDLEPGEIGEDDAGLLILAVLDSGGEIIYLWLSGDVTQAQIARDRPIVRILPLGTLLEVE